MNLARATVFVAAALVLAGGYFASLSAFFSGETKRYTESVDASPLPLLALVLVLTCVVLAALPQRGDES